MGDQSFYVVVDIETDGPFPGQHAMRNLSAVATDDRGKELGSFSVNLDPPLNTAPDPDTLAWWQQEQPGIWAQINADPLPVRTAILDFEAFVRGYDGRRIFLAHPLAFDGVWIDHYMQKVLGQGLMAFHGVEDPLFFGAGIDLPSFVSGALGIDYGLCRHGSYPSDVATDLAHTHHGLDDARGHADVLRKTLKILHQRQ